jgi:hypothetical protein
MFPPGYDAKMTQDWGEDAQASAAAISQQQRLLVRPSAARSTGIGEKRSETTRNTDNLLGKVTQRAFFYDCLEAL